MHEIVPGIHHWIAFHEGIRQPVHSYYVQSAAALIDPMVPPEGLGWFEQRGRPTTILLTNRHHYRHSARFVEAFGCAVRCSEPGLHEFREGRQVEGFRFGEQVAPGITAIEIGAICPDETALHIGRDAVAFADGLIRSRGKLGFVPDGLIGDDPDAVKKGLYRALAGLLDLDFDALLLAHGEPVAAGGKAALREFVEEAAA
jgi:hypothetical protein